MKYIVMEEDADFGRINSELDEEFVDYHFDGNDTYSVDDDDAETFEDVLDELGINYEEL